MPGVYISYPFCTQKCTFCNFASGVGSSDARLQYESSLSAEIAQHTWEWLPETLYLGGGTPSLLEPEPLRQILATIPRENLIENTIECAPGTITRDRVRVWGECGINRVSLGVQSFDATELHQSGRRHTAEIVESDITLLRAEGISNINIDLIAGLPHQTKASWAGSLEWLERLGPPHVSVYLFEVDDDSRLGKEILLNGTRYGAPYIPSEDLAAELYEIAVERLTRLGYEHYEISNFARRGAESRHNLKYWRLEPYIGFGLDAHSFDGRVRWGNPDTLPDYLARRGESHRCPVDSSEERFFVGLRLIRGIEPTPEERHRFATPIAKWIQEGMLITEGNILRLSPRGVLVSNEVFADFVHA